MAIDPYAAPNARLFAAASPVADREALALREGHFAHEAGVRAVGLACLVFGAVLTWIGARITWFVVADLLKGRDHALSWSSLAFCAAMLGAGGLGLAGAWGYFALRPWVRRLALPLALGAALTSFGFATPMVLYAAWLTWSRAGRTVLAPDYAAVIARAPGWPRWWQLGHVAAIVGLVALYVAMFYGVMWMDAGDD